MSLHRKLRKVYESDLHPTVKVQRVVSARNEELAFCRKEISRLKRSLRGPSEKRIREIAEEYFDDKRIDMLLCEDAIKQALSERGT